MQFAADGRRPFLVEFARMGSLAQRTAHLARLDVDETWLGLLASLTSELPLHDSDSATGLGPDLLAAAAAPPSAFPGLAHEPAAIGSEEQRRETALGLAQLIGQLDRVAAWAGARQAAAMAALARPGVAVPVGDLLDAVTQGRSGGPLGTDSADALRSSDFEAETWQEVSVSGDPVWDDAVQEQAARIAAAEVGAQLAWAPSTARSRMAESTDVVDALPRAHQLWSLGRLDRSRVMVLADRTRDLDPAARELVEEQLLDDGGAVVRAKTPARVRALVDRCAAALDPEAIRRRQERARQDRDVFVSPRDDGMSRFSADVATPVAVLARAVIDCVAKDLPSERSIGQRRADVFADIFTRLAADGHVDLRRDPDPSTSNCPAAGQQQPTDRPDIPTNDSTTVGTSSLDAPNADTRSEDTPVLPPDWERIDSGVTVVVDASTLAGVDLADTASVEGALLGSHPALPEELVTALARSARRVRIAVKGATMDAGSDACASGCASAATNLALGADVYRPSAKLAEQLLLRDRVCRFPGCRHPARACDLDHRVPFAEGGPTTAENMDALCRFHHRLKTFTGWRAVRAPGNCLTWTTPLGAVIADDPELVSAPGMTPPRPPGPSSPLDDPPPF
ncbi:DUF222 domain-containing protein [Nakamurella sp. A5-74]|uniref:DUF222 domain-containing protein n=1 Tax=Nakamurella sp. A5-74 TaxID=3158264 RepID=A0AAU8DRD9_9ACTN